MKSKFCMRSNLYFSFDDLFINYFKTETGSEPRKIPSNVDLSLKEIPGKNKSADIQSQFPPVCRPKKNNPIEDKRKIYLGENIARNI